jgi:hypothetical protein
VGVAHPEEFIVLALRDLVEGGRVTLEIGIAS